MMKLFLIILLSQIVLNQSGNNMGLKLLKAINKIILGSNSEKSSEEKLQFIKKQLKGVNYDYMKFIPIYVGSLKEGESLTEINQCFRNSKFSLISNEQGPQLNLELQDSSSWFCSDFYLFAFHGQYKLEEYYMKGNKKVQFKVPTNEANSYDYQTNGVRIFKFVSNRAATLEQIALTASLFVPFATKSVPSLLASQNQQFVKNYVGVEMKKRSITDVNIDPSLIQSGDFFGIERLDGIDPLLGFGMGSSTGHTVVAQRIDGVLHICESQAIGAYWDINGIQCNEYELWMKKAKEASMNVVWVPLSQESRKKYDEQKSLEFFRSVEGFNYGYITLLMGWLDTLDKNLPCLPPSYTQCISPQLFDILFDIVEGIDKDLTIVWKQAVGKRAGLEGSNYTVSEAYRQAGLKGIQNIKVYQIPEQDAWLYDTFRYDEKQKQVGPSMVCCVFVCRMWKAAGLFGDKTQTINCGEFTNTDVYKLDVFSKDPRPEACVQADPENPVCQLLGDYTLRLDVGPGKQVHFNRVPIVEHQAENCPSQNPDYLQNDDC